MKYAVEIDSGAVIYIPSFMKIGSVIQWLIIEDTQTHRLHSDIVRPTFIYFFFKIGN
jgi:hypothetical protein